MYATGKLLACRYAPSFWCALAALALSLSGCGGDEPDRYYGNVAVALDPSAAIRGEHLYSFTPQHIAQDSNMVTLHFDFFGIPWTEFASGSTLPAAWVAEMDKISNLVDELDLPVFLALTPLGDGRIWLAKQASGTESLVLQTYGSECAIDDRDTVLSAYRAYTDYMVDRFSPRFLSLTIEVNMFYQACPEAWPEMKSILNDVYAEQKSKHPDLPILHTFQIDWLWEASSEEEPCWGYTHTCLESNLAMADGLSTDVFAISSYPLTPHANSQRLLGQPLPSEWISIFAEKTDVPLAVAETGYPYYSITVEEPVSGNCTVALPSSEADQQWWLERVLGDSVNLDMAFVTWWGNHDGFPAFAVEPCVCDAEDDWCTLLNMLPDGARLAGRFFGSMGLRDFEGNPRPLLDIWKEAVAGEYKPPCDCPPGYKCIDGECVP